LAECSEKPQKFSFILRVPLNIQVVWESSALQNMAEISVSACRAALTLSV